VRRRANGALSGHKIAAVVKSLRDEFGFPIFLNADHTHSRASAEEVARAGFDSIVFDLSALPLEQNVRQAREAVAALKAINPSMLVEGEIGDIGSGSEIHETMSAASKKLTTPEEARQFVVETGVDILAPAVGNMHGIQEHGSGSFKAAPGHRPDSSDSEGRRSAADSSRRIRNRRWRFSQGYRRWHRHCPYEHRSAGYMEAEPGRQPRRQTGRRCSLQDSPFSGRICKKSGHVPTNALQQSTFGGLGIYR